MYERSRLSYMQHVDVDKCENQNKDSLTTIIHIHLDSSIMSKKCRISWPNVGSFIAVLCVTTARRAGTGIL
jgi:hypothetical protein